jgi:hypothetical protein
MAEDSTREDDVDDSDPSSAPLDDLAERIRSRQSDLGDAGTERGDEPGVDEFFQEAAFEEIGSDELWDSLDEEEPSGGPTVEVGEGPDEHIVPKRSYCENCEHFSVPPEVHCDHTGTTIVEFVDLDHVRVRNCPIVKQRQELSERGTSPTDPDAFEGIAPGQRLVLIEVSLPVLRQLSAAQTARFRACLGHLMAEESHPGALQWALHRLVVQGMEGQRRARADRHLGEMTGPLSLLLSTLVLAGHADGDDARRALARVASSLGLSLDFVPEPALASELDWAMGRLVRLVREERAPLLVAMTCCVEQDGRIEPLEAELLSAIAWTLGCPLPDPSRHDGLASDGLAGQDGR